nr:ORF1 [Torque teno felis virus]
MARFWRKRRWRKRKFKPWWYRTRWTYKPRFRKKRRWRKRRRVSKRTKQTVTLWNPESRVRCTITGFVLGITTDNIHTTTRLYNTWWTNDVANKFLVGGGVSLNIFTLKFLWMEHRLYHNFWSQTNDGYDLARYYKTTWYLPPLRDVDYIFWWDTDIGIYQPQDYLRCHPVNLLATKNARFVRNCKYNHNYKTKKVTIRPPSNITNQWKYQTDWLDFPLFIWGVTLIDWKNWFAYSTTNPLPMVTLQANKQTSASGPNKSQTIVYCPYIDTGKGNKIDVCWSSPTEPAYGPTGASDWKPVVWATDLPYWLTLYGTNRNMDMNVIDRTFETNNAGSIAWLRISWPAYTTAAQIEGGQFQNKFETWVLTGTEAQKIARSGPFVAASYSELVQLPLLYKSYWSWGRINIHKPASCKIGGTAKSQVSVKNPATLQNYVIRPWDTSGGLLTKSALRRFLEPSTVPDERPTLPLEKPPTGNAPSEEYDETASEAEESEEDEDGEEDVRSTLRALKRRLLREQLKRRQFNKLLKCLVRDPGEQYTLQE